MGFRSFRARTTQKSPVTIFYILPLYKCKAMPYIANSANHKTKGNIMKMNRADRRAIQFGHGRNSPMIEIYDIPSLMEYTITLNNANYLKFQRNLDNLFIKTQVWEELGNATDWDEEQFNVWS